MGLTCPLVCLWNCSRNDDPPLTLGLRGAEQESRGDVGMGKISTPADGFVLIVHHSEGATGADVITFGMHWDDNDRFEDFPTTRCQDNSI